MNKDKKDIYAIIKCGGKQYRVAPNDVIDVELIDKEKGSSIEFGEILFVSTVRNPPLAAPIFKIILLKVNCWIL